MSDKVPAVQVDLGHDSGVVGGPQFNTREDLDRFPAGTRLQDSLLDFQHVRGGGARRPMNRAAGAARIGAVIYKIR